MVPEHIIINWLPRSSFSVFEFDKKRFFIKMAPAVPKKVIAKFPKDGCK